METKLTFLIKNSTTEINLWSKYNLFYIFSLKNMFPISVYDKKKNTLKKTNPTNDIKSTDLQQYSIIKMLARTAINKF